MLELWIRKMDPLSVFCEGTWIPVCREPSTTGVLALLEEICLSNSNKNGSALKEYEEM